MILHIDTSDNEVVHISLLKGKTIVVKKKFKARFKQAERLLPEIDKMLKSSQVSLPEINEILVADHGGSFTSLRIGVVTANALAYALKIAVISEHSQPSQKKAKAEDGIHIIKPRYSSGPNITIKKPR